MRAPSFSNLSIKVDETSRQGPVPSLSPPPDLHLWYRLGLGLLPAPRRPDYSKRVVQKGQEAGILTYGPQSFRRRTCFLELLDLEHDYERVWASVGRGLYSASIRLRIFE